MIPSRNSFYWTKTHLSIFFLLLDLFPKYYHYRLLTLYLSINFRSIIDINYFKLLFTTFQIIFNYGWQSFNQFRIIVVNLLIDFDLLLTYFQLLQIISNTFQLILTILQLFQIIMTTLKLISNSYLQSFNWFKLLLPTFQSVSI